MRMQSTISYDARRYGCKVCHCKKYEPQSNVLEFFKDRFKKTR